MATDHSFIPFSTQRPSRVNGPSRPMPAPPVPRGQPATARQIRYDTLCRAAVLAAGTKLGPSPIGDVSDGRVEVPPSVRLPATRFVTSKLPKRHVVPAPPWVHGLPRRTRVELPAARSRLQVASNWSEGADAVGRRTPSARRRRRGATVVHSPPPLDGCHHVVFDVRAVPRHLAVQPPARLVDGHADFRDRTVDLNLARLQGGSGWRCCVAQRIASCTRAGR